MSQKKTNSKFTERTRQRRAYAGRRGLRRRGKRWLYPAAMERVYTNKLISKVDLLIELVNAQLVNRLPQLHAQARVTLDSKTIIDKVLIKAGVRQDDFIDDIKVIIAALTIGAADIVADVEEIATGFALNIASFNETQYKGVINSALGVNPYADDIYLQKMLKSYAAQNAALIKSLPDNMLRDVEGIVLRGLTSGSTINSIQTEIQKKFKTTRSRARLIARDQTGKLNAQLTKVRQERIGINEYVWSTSDDERVRDSHRVLDGLICRWDDATIYRVPGETQWRKRSSIGGYIGHPGTDYQCRCFGEPILEGLIDESETE